jgi:hypothetical protein
LLNFKYYNKNLRKHFIKMQAPTAVPKKEENVEMNSTSAPTNEGASEILAVRGETYTIPQARFGHTSTTVSKHKIV